jgi:hypothetical protein
LRESAVKSLKEFDRVNLCGIIPLTQVIESGMQMLRDRPDEIEVTPAMIEAGATALFGSWVDYPDLPVARDSIASIAKAVFLAMMFARSTRA